MRRWLAGVMWIGSATGLAADLAPLADAVAAGRSDTVAAHLAAGASLNARQADGMTALLWAVYRNDTAVALTLLEAGADPHAANLYGVTAIHLACLNGNAELITALIARGVDPNSARAGGETALMTAARTGGLAAVRVLVDAGAEIEAKLDGGQTALMWAAAEGHLEVVKHLMDAGADYRSALPSGFTPLLFAVREGHADLVDLLLRSGVNPNEIIEPTSEKRGHKPPKKGSSPLILAIENGHFELAVDLLNAGADPNDQRSGFAPLHTLSWVRRPDLGDNASGDPVPLGRGRLTSMDMARALVEHGAEVNLALTQGSRRGKGGAHLPDLGNTPFLLACHTGDVEMARFLLAEGADPFKRNADGTSAILIAAGLGNHAPEEEAGSEDEALQLLEILLELGCDINDTDSNAETVMHGAAYKNFPRVARFLDAHGADIAKWNQPNDRGWTPLDIAEGYRPGNFKPSAATSQAIEAIMLARGVTPDRRHRQLQNQYE